MKVLIVSPAYGRDYKTEEDAVKDWKEGKDFRIETIGIRGTYVSSREVGNDFDQINIRYDRKMEVAVIEMAPRYLSMPDPEIGTRIDWIKFKLGTGPEPGSEEWQKEQEEKATEKPGPQLIGEPGFWHFPALKRGKCGEPFSSRIQQ